MASAWVQRVEGEKKAGSMAHLPVFLTLLAAGITACASTGAMTPAEHDAPYLKERAPEACVRGTGGSLRSVAIPDTEPGGSVEARFSYRK